MRAYVAGPFAAREKIACRATDLEIIGYEVGARWLTEPGGAAGAGLEVCEVERARHAAMDLADVAACDVFVMFTPDALNVTTPLPFATSGGRHFEAGFAHAHGKHVVVVGGAENIFHVWPMVTVLDDWRTALTHLADVRRGRRQWEARA